MGLHSHGASLLYAFDSILTMVRTATEFWCTADAAQLSGVGPSPEGRAIWHRHNRIDPTEWSEHPRTPSRNWPRGWLRAMGISSLELAADDAVVSIETAVDHRDRQHIVRGWLQITGGSRSHNTATLEDQTGTARVVMLRDRTENFVPLSGDGDVELTITPVGDAELPTWWSDADLVAHLFDDEPDMGPGWAQRTAELISASQFVVTRIVPLD